MRSRLWILGVVAAVAAGAAARASCLGAEFWLDEIWSLELAREAKSPADVFFHTRHDNNHHLNTLALHLVPDGVWWGWYRLHSLVAGTAAVAVAARAARRWGKAEAVVAAWLVAGCSWFVLASAEARGYALGVLFALVAFDALWGYLDSRSPGWLALYWAATLAGFLSHLTFVYATMGFVVWSLRRYSREKESSGGEVRQLALTHGPPGVLVVAFYLYAVRGMEKGGGPPAATGDVLASLFGQGLGGLPAAWLLLAAWAFAAGLWLLRREGEVWVFFLVSCLLAPGLYLLMRPPYLFERYFFAPFAFFLLLLARVLCQPLRAKAGPWFVPDLRSLAAAALLAYLLGNGHLVWRFSQAGRGDFQKALAYVLEQDDGSVVRVKGDHPFRVPKYVGFYGPRSGREVVYTEDGARWLFVHHLDDHAPPDALPDGNDVYRLEKSFPSRGPGAWGWFVYRKAE